MISKIMISSTYLLSKIQYQLFHLSLGDKDSSLLNSIIKTFILNSAHKYSDARASDKASAGGLNIPIWKYREKCFKIKAFKWLLKSKDLNLSQLASSKLYNIKNSFMIYIIQHPLYGYNMKETYQKTLEFYHHKPCCPTKTQLTMIGDGLILKLALTNILTSKLPIIHKDILFKFLTKSLPLFHKNKKSLPFIESSSGIFFTNQSRQLVL